MPRASTLTDIANLSLASIGEVLIENIDDQTAVSRAINRVLYESIRQTQLEIFWEDLIEVFEPTQLTAPYPGSAGLNQYNMPTNFLDIVSLESGANWMLRGGKLVTEDEAPVVTYKRYSEEPSEWSGYLVELIYRRIAANVAMPLTQNPQITQMASEAYRTTMMSNLVRSTNRSRKVSYRAEGFGNVRSRIHGRGRWPLGFGQRAGGRNTL